MINDKTIHVGIVKNITEGMDRLFIQLPERKEDEKAQMKVLVKTLPTLKVSLDFDISVRGKRFGAMFISIDVDSANHSVSDIAKIIINGIENGGSALSKTSEFLMYIMNASDSLQTKNIIDLANVTFKEGDMLDRRMLTYNRAYNCVVMNFDARLTDSSNLLKFQVENVVSFIRSIAFAFGVKHRKKVKEVAASLLVNEENGQNPYMTTCTNGEVWAHSQRAFISGFAEKQR